MNCTIRQAVDVWGELMDAFYDRNGYGGQTAEIYSYRLEQYSPGVHSTPNKVSDMYVEDAIRIAKDAAFALLGLCKLFEEKYNCDIFIHEKTLSEWERDLNEDKGRFNRYHVQVVERE